MMGNRIKLLVVEDEVKAAEILKQGLEEKGYLVTVVHSGTSAIRAVIDERIDLVLLDLIIPKQNGFEVCSAIKDLQPQLPVIMLTALGLTGDKVRGFTAGSDDYLVKPYDFEELLIRIKVALRRVQKRLEPDNFLEYSDLRINLDTKEVFRSGKLIILSAKEYLLLQFFLKHKHKVVTKAEIAREVWNHSFDTGTNVIEVYVSYLRNKIDKGFNKKLIHNRKGIGYIFREEA